MSWFLADVHLVGADRVKKIPVQKEVIVNVSLGLQNKN